MKIKSTSSLYALIVSTALVAGCHAPDPTGSTPADVQEWRDSAALWEAQYGDSTYQFRFGECVYYGSVAFSDVCRGGYGYRKVTAALVIDGTPTVAFEVKAPEGPFAPALETSLRSPISIQYYFDSSEDLLTRRYIAVSYDQYGLPVLEWDYDNGHSFTDAEVKRDLISVTPRADAIASLDTHRARWNSLNAQNYTYTVSMTCDCNVGELLVTIENGSLKKVFSVEQNQEIPAETLALPITIEELFDLVATRLESQKAIIDATYNEAHGFPERVSLFEEHSNASGASSAEYLSIELLDFIVGDPAIGSEDS